MRVLEELEVGPGVHLQHRFETVRRRLPDRETGIVDYPRAVGMDVDVIRGECQRVGKGSFRASRIFG